MRGWPKAMYEEQHASISMLTCRFRNQAAMQAAAPHELFRWMHRVYGVLDGVMSHYPVYKLYGGPQGFSICAGVAEPDEHHAANLLRCAAHILRALEPIRFPGGQQPDVVLALASGPASSGLLGVTNPTYQVVGHVPVVAQELAHTQLCLPFVVTRATWELLPKRLAADLVFLGRVPLRCCGGQEEELWGLPAHRHLPVTRLLFDRTFPELPAGSPPQSPATPEPLELRAASLPSPPSRPSMRAALLPPPPGPRRLAVATRPRPSSPEPLPAAAAAEDGASSEPATPTSPGCCDAGACPSTASSCASTSWEG